MVLTNFIKREGIKTKNLLDLFIENHKLGEMVINEGILYPIYSIPELDYSLIVSYSTGRLYS